MIRFTQALVLIVCVCHGLAAAETDSPDTLPRDVPGSVSLLPPSYTEIEGFRKNFTSPAAKTFSLNIVPTLMELKALYFEREEGALSPLEPNPAPSKWGRYFGLLATSGHFGGKLVAEGEIAYSALGFSAQPDERPIMSRLGVRGNWDKLKYGLGYRSFGSGFVSMSGVKVDHARDENELWGEYDFQSFRLKTTLAEWREKNSTANQLTLTRSAATGLNWSRQSWSALFSSSYSLISNREDSQSFAFSNGLSVSYRPTRFITIQPDLSFREEWDHVSGLRTDTPSAALAVIGSLHPGVQLIGRASYANGASEDPLKNSSTMNTAAGFNWKLGRSFFGEQSLSFQVEYKNEVRTQVPTTQQANLSGTVQFKVAGF